VYFVPNEPAPTTTTGNSVGQYRRPT
jgi:hypothetical protein